MRVFVTALVAAALLHSPAFARNLAEWDADASGTISESEFTNGFRSAGMFVDGDGSADGQLRLSWRKAFTVFGTVITTEIC